MIDYSICLSNFYYSEPTIYFTFYLEGYFKINLIMS